MHRIYGNLVSYYVERCSANEDAIQWFLRDSHSYTMLEEITETDIKKYTGLQEAIQVCQDNDAVLITNEAVKFDHKLRPMTLLLQSKVRVIGIDWAPMFKPVSTAGFLKKLTMLARKKKEEQSRKIRDGQKRVAQAGKTFRNPKGSPVIKHAQRANKERWKAFRLQVYPLVQRLKEEEQTQSLTRLCELLEERNVKTVTGKSKWYPSVLKEIIYEGDKR